MGIKLKNNRKWMSSNYWNSLGDEINLLQLHKHFRHINLGYEKEKKNRCIYEKFHAKMFNYLFEIF